MAPSNPLITLRDADLYFADGNIVLAAPDAGRASVSCFRVHKSILAKHSPVFSDMFSLPSPQLLSDDDIYDDILKVDLHDDALIVRIFLKFLYEPFSPPSNFWSWHNPSTIAQRTQTMDIVGLLKFADKYQADALRSHICLPLFRDWPYHYSKWDAQEDFIMKKFMHPSAIICIARDFPPDSDFRHVLPLAFYLLSCSLSNKAKDWDEGGLSFEESLSLLTREDMATLAFGRVAMGKWVSERTRLEFFGWHSQRSFAGNICDCPPKIQQRWASLQNDVLETMDVLHILGSQCCQYSAPELCSICKDLYRTATSRMRENFFTELPDIFGFKRPPNTLLKRPVRVC